MKAIQLYHARMQRVLDHIEEHLDDDLSLEALSSVAAFSKFHFHRQFTSFFGISASQYVHLARMKRASHRLAFRQADSITEIALDAAYEAPEAFTRAFKRQFGQSPSAFRKAPDWEPWSVAIGPLAKARRKSMDPFSTDDVVIIDAPHTKVAIMKHRGDPASIGDTIQRFINWRKDVGLGPKISNTYTVFHTDPQSVPPAEFHADLCAEIVCEIGVDDDCVKVGEIPAGRCASLRITGSGDDLEAAANFLYRDWLPQSGEQTRDFPLYCQRVSFFPDVPENAAATDLFLPLK